MFKMKQAYHILFLLSGILVSISNISSQGVSINESNTPAADDAILDISSTNKGMLIPRMTESERQMISNPASGSPSSRSVCKAA